MKLYWTYIVVFLYHQGMALQPNYCEFFDEVFEYVPQTVVVQVRKERKKEGIVASIDPRKLLERSGYKNVTKTEMVAVKRMRSYVACCVGFIKFEGNCVPKSGPSTTTRPPTPMSSSVQPRSFTSSTPSASVSSVTASSSTTAGRKVASSGGGSSMMDEAVTEDQREAVTPAAIRLDQGNPLVNDELEIAATAAEVDQSDLPTLFIGR